MLTHPAVTVQMIQQRHDELRQEAAEARLARQVRYMRMVPEPSRRHTLRACIQAVRARLVPAPVVVSHR